MENVPALKSYRKRKSTCTQPPSTDISSEDARVVPPIFLDVVCGQSHARLGINWLGLGTKMACVLVGENTWMTPNQYQHFSGRGTARDWKRSIKHNGTSLKALLSNKTLSLDPPLCICSQCRQKSPQVRKNILPSEDSYSYSIVSSDLRNEIENDENNYAENWEEKKKLMTSLELRMTKSGESEMMSRVQNSRLKIIKRLSTTKLTNNNDDDVGNKNSEANGRTAPGKDAGKTGTTFFNIVISNGSIVSQSTSVSYAGSKLVLSPVVRNAGSKQTSSGNYLVSIVKKPRVESSVDEGREAGSRVLLGDVSVCRQVDDNSAGQAIGSNVRVKDVALSHIISELRNYKRSLEDRIHATRASLSNLPLVKQSHHSTASSVALLLNPTSATNYSTTGLFNQKSSASISSASIDSNTVLSGKYSDLLNSLSPLSMQTNLTVKAPVNIRQEKNILTEKSFSTLIKNAIGNGPSFAPDSVHSTELLSPFLNISSSSTNHQTNSFTPLPISLINLNKLKPSQFRTDECGALDLTRKIFGSTKTTQSVEEVLDLRIKSEPAKGCVESPNVSLVPSVESLVFLTPKTIKPVTCKTTKKTRKSLRDVVQAKKHLQQSAA